MKKFLAGLVGAIATLSISSVAHAQDYETLTVQDCPQIVTDVVCYQVVDDRAIVWVIPVKYEGTYVLTAQPIDSYVFIVLLERESGSPVAYMLLDDGNQMVTQHRGKPGYGGDTTLLQEFFQKS